MNEHQKRGQRMLIGLILGGVLFTVLGIAFHPDNQAGVGARPMLFFVLLLAILAGLYQGRLVPKLLTLILLLAGIVLGGQWLMNDNLQLPVLIVVVIAILYFAGFIAALLFSKQVAAYLALRQGKTESEEA